MNMYDLYANAVLRLLRPALELERAQRAANTDRITKIVTTVIAEARRPGGLLHVEQTDQKGQERI